MIVAAVLARQPAHDLDEAGVGIDLDDAGMRRAGEGHRRRIVAILRLQTRLHAGRQARRLAIGDLGDLAQAARLVRRAGDVDHAVLDRDALGIGVEDVRSDALHLVPEQRGRFHRGAAADHALAAAGGARPEAAARAVAFEHA